MLHLPRVFTFILLLAAFPMILCSQSASDVIKKADMHGRGKSSAAELTITTYRPGWERVLELKSWTRGSDEALILIVQPPKEKGIVFLKKGREIWNWLPSIDRNIKLPPSMMGQSWMGTDFTNDDLVKESSIVVDYTHQFLKDTTLDQRICYQILLTPKPEAAVVWGKIKMTIDKQDFIMLMAKYYDEEGFLVQTMTGSEVTNLGGRVLPSRFVLVPADKKGHRTEMKYKRMAFDLALPADYFTTQNMTKVR
ncbi:MAG: outer membrane lipoprotein-sorting protein [Saprospiraceae bacterium]|jgi:outer membrane lipoprotein-sorting protein|nr:outer membrane lipoprotein-sorting protein [Saprospiraceae bacterium]